MRSAFCIFGFAFLFTGCVSMHEEAAAARASLLSGENSRALEWSAGLAEESRYSQNLGAVEAGRIRLLAGDVPGAEQWLRKAVDSAVDRTESAPKIRLRDVGNAFLASTIADDRTREYYLPPYELNMALQYAILAQCLALKPEEALVDARLAVYVQDSLAENYGADVKRGVSGKDEKTNAAAVHAVAQETAKLSEMIASTRNSWENPVLWWLTGVLFEADGDTEMAWQSYRKALALRGDCAVFVRDAMRADAGKRVPAPGKARLALLYEEGLVPIRKPVKIFVPHYTVLGIHVPAYDAAARYLPGRVEVTVATNSAFASPALDVRALAARDLLEQMPGIAIRNISRVALQIAAQAAAKASGNEYAQIGVLFANAFISAAREADTRSWTTLPSGQQVWSMDSIEPGTYFVEIEAGGRKTALPVTLNAGETVLAWVADFGGIFRTGAASLSGNSGQGGKQ